MLHENLLRIAAAEIGQWAIPKHNGRRGID
jgi:hypothetical protein